jgi:Tfp pilus assembly protein PilO
MKKLSTDKRNKLIMVVVVTATIIGAVYFLLISPQQEQNRTLAKKTSDELARLQTIKKTIKDADANNNKSEKIITQLSSAEADAASGDVFAWTYDTIRQFKVNRHVDITTIGQPIQSDVDILPNFPYKQIKFQIIGNGFYQDIGKFVADLENKYPHMRVLSITIDPNLGAEASPEKLSFRLEIAALLKSNT